MANWDKWDTIVGYLFGFLSGVFAVVFPLLILDGMTYIEAIKEMSAEFLLFFKVSMFFYAVRNAVKFIKPPYRTRAFIPTNFWHFLSGNLIALAWLMGGFAILLGPEVIIKIIEMWGN